MALRRERERASPCLLELRIRTSQEQEKTHTHTHTLDQVWKYVPPLSPTTRKLMIKSLIGENSVLELIMGTD
jgi:hypothetical protein